MSKRLEMGNLLSDLRYQLAPGAHTFSKCSRDGCDISARGGRACLGCTEESIDRLIGKAGWGDKAISAICNYHDLQADLLEMAEQMDSANKIDAEFERIGLNDAML